MEATTRILARYEGILDYKMAILNDSRGEGVRISLKCSACMMKRQQMPPVYVSAKGEAKTGEAAGRIAAERVLQQHSQCLGLRSTPAKRTWLEAASLQQKDTAEKKAKSACIAQADEIERLRGLERSHSMVRVHAMQIFREW